MTTQKFKDFIQNSRTFVFIGNGGTGKTTVSASWALELAKTGERVGLLTIDPSKRLGDAFGMNIEKEFFKSVTVGSGSIDVFLIDAKQVIEEFITENFSKEQYDKVKNNRIFSQVSSALSENQSVSTIYKLHQMIKSQKYDRIVVDTPPSNNSMDFFTSPDLVVRIFKENILARAALEAKSFSFFSGQKLFRRVYTFLVGEEFFKDIEAFFQILFLFQDYIVQSSEELMVFLRNPETHFLAVTLPDAAKVKEVLAVVQKLGQQNIDVKTLVINRAYPSWLSIESSAMSFKPEDTDIETYYKAAQSYYAEQAQRAKSLASEVDRALSVYFLPENSNELETEGVFGFSSHLLKMFGEKS